LTTKILTEIIGKHGEIVKRKKFPVEDGTVLIRKGKRGPGGAAYKPKFNRNCLLWEKRGLIPFKSYKPKLMLMEGADRCIEFNSDSVDIPMWDRKTEENLFKASVIKAAGATVQKIQIPFIFYILIFFGIILQFFTILILTGRVRI